MSLAGGRFWPLTFAVLLAALSAATYGVQNAPARYFAARTGPAPEIWPPDDVRQWQRSRRGLTFSGAGAKSEVRLAARRAPGVAAIQAALAVPDGADGLRVELRLGAEALKPGTEAWQNARLQLLSFDRAGHFLWYWPKDAIEVSGDRPFGPMSAVLPLRKDLKGVLVRIYNGADSGSLRIGSPKIELLAERPVFAFLRGGLAAVWIAAGLWAAWTAARRAATPARAGLLLAVAALALVSVLAPQPAFREAIEPVRSLALAAADSVTGRQAPLPSRPPRMPAARGDTGGEATADGRARGTADKLTEPPASEPAAPGPLLVSAAPGPDYPLSFKEFGHFSVFLMLGVAGFAAFPRSSWYGRALCLAGFAVATESLQWFVVTRSSSVKDLAVDLAGLALAAVAVAIGSRVTAAAKARNRNRASRGARS